MSLATLPATALITPKEAANILGVGEATLSIWRCTRRYPLPYVKVGRAVKYRLDAVEEFIRQRTVGGGSSQQ